MVVVVGGVCSSSVVSLYFSILDKVLVLVTLSHLSHTLHFVCLLIKSVVKKLGSGIIMFNVILLYAKLLINAYCNYYVL